MSKVNHTKAGKDYPEHDIKKGDMYYWWQNFRCPRQISKTCPKPSQVTANSKLSAVYGISENLEEQASKLGSPGDLIDLLETSASDARDVAEEYRETAENIREAFSDSPPPTKLSRMPTRSTPGLTPWTASSPTSRASTSTIFWTTTTAGRPRMTMRLILRSRTSTSDSRRWSWTNCAP